MSDGVKYLFCLLFLCILKNADAQYETANWVFSEYSLNFIADPPTTLPTTFENDEGEFATYSSDEGKLLITTDGSTVWNGEGKIMKNGENITPYRTRSIIIPKPASDNQYYIFSYNAFNVPGNNNNTLSVIVYAVVDLNANNNQGEVIEKNKVLFNNMHGTFTISGKCDRSVFWLVGEVDTNLTEGSDKIYIFQIDKEGIQGPFVSKPLTIGRGSDFKLSPDARKFFFTVTGNSGSGSLVADFKPENLPEDPIENVKWIPASGSGEFSPNSRFVYLTTGNQLIQYDTQTGSNYEIFSGPDVLGVPQMAANGKIYVSVDSKLKLMSINHPDLPGFSCGFSESGIVIPTLSFVLPSFASNLFYRGSYPADAGSDKVICPDESVTIGGLENAATPFTWKPTIFLDDPDKIQPTFQYTGSDEEGSFTYRLTTYYEGCSHNDFVIINRRTRPLAPIIYGSRSVCPGVDGVQYTTETREKFSYQWNARGGIIVGESNSGSVRINWGPASLTAQVGLQAIDEYGCASAFTFLDVVIDTQLLTETPRGLDSICINLTSQNNYRIEKSSGSMYTWGITDGEIISGQGNNAVIVNWYNNPYGKIWVNEKSVTNDAVCTGVSDTLQVTIFKDPAVVNLDYISVDEVDERRINLQASTPFANRIKEVSIWQRRDGSGIWEEMDTMQVNPVMQVTMDNFLTDDYSYQFQVDILNKCNERSLSNIHKTIRLSAVGDEAENLIDLRWSSYNFWNAEDVTYEILTSFDEPPDYTTSVTVINDTISSILADESFLYNLRVKAVRSDGLFTSLSNEVKIELSHELVIPNVITPNDDGFNDTFEIKNIKLYPQNRLTIFNRYGKTMFDQSHYEGGWNGGEGSSGVFYFTLQVPEKQKEYKGWLQVIR